MEKIVHQQTQPNPSSINRGRQHPERLPQIPPLGGLTRTLSGRSSLRPVTGDGLNRKEVRLAQLVNQYRRSNNLSGIRLSKALTIVANRHVRDLVKNGVQGSLHAWSNAPYDSSNPKTYPSMWLAPKRLGTGYTGYGYENAFASYGVNASPRMAFDAWKNSSGHNAVILNQGGWGNYRWNALGVGMYKGFAVLWFGKEPDPTGKPIRE